MRYFRLQPDLYKHERFYLRKTGIILHCKSEINIVKRKLYIKNWYIK